MGTVKVTIYLLYVWLGPQLQVNDVGDVVDDYKPQLMGQYQSKARCESDRQIFVQEHRSECIPEVVVRDKD